MQLYEIEVKTSNGELKSLKVYQGKILLVVNTASQCGFTSQYKGLEALYRQYKFRGFEVLAFPCNQFGNQEPGSIEDIKGFCALNFGISFEIFDKINVNGPETHPLYNFLKHEKGGLLGDQIKWNFTKFLVDSNGVVIKRYPSTFEPLTIAKDIEKLLPQD